MNYLNERDPYTGEFEVKQHGDVGTMGDAAGLQGALKSMLWVMSQMFNTAEQVKTMNKSIARMELCIMMMTALIYAVVIGGLIFAAITLISRRRQQRYQTTRRSGHKMSRQVSENVHKRSYAQLPAPSNSSKPMPPTVQVFREDV